MFRNTKGKIFKVRDRLETNRNLIYYLLIQPNIYFAKLIKNTLIIGAISLLLSYLYIHSDYKDLRIPIGLHSVIGLVIGLLLIFRTNTAYDRWWSGTKYLVELKIAVTNLSTLYRYTDKVCLKINNELIELLDLIKMDLQLRESLSNKIIDKSKSIRESFETQRETKELKSELAKILNMWLMSDKIKNTPIPLSYALHINVSIMIYLLTLPFGLFYDLELYSSIMVMVIYYIVMGIEIISSEIENPFEDQPNDIPLDKIFNEMKSIVSSHIK